MTITHLAARLGAKKRLGHSETIAPFITLAPQNGNVGTPRRTASPISRGATGSIISTSTATSGLKPVIHVCARRARPLKGQLISYLVMLTRRLRSLTWLRWHTGLLVMSAVTTARYHLLSALGPSIVTFIGCFMRPRWSREVTAAIVIR